MTQTSTTTKRGTSERAEVALTPFIKVSSVSVHVENTDERVDHVQQRQHQQHEKKVLVENGIEN